MICILYQLAMLGETTFTAAYSVFNYFFSYAILLITYAYTNVWWRVYELNRRVDYLYIWITFSLEEGFLCKVSFQD